MRKKLIVGNWKMNYTITEAEAFVSSIKDRINTDIVDVTICPNFVALGTVSKLLENTNIHLGAQNVYYEDKGAYTGETSAPMLVSAFVDFCIVGHSERRIHNKETNESLINKLNNCKKYDIIPLYCIGEKNNVNELNEQVDLYLNNVNTNKAHIIYEPVKNIGSNEINIEEIKNNINYITTYIKEKYNKDVNLIYGGGVNINNIEQLKNIKEIDGLILSRDALDIDNLDKIYKITNS